MKEMKFPNAVSTASEAWTPPANREWFRENGWKCPDSYNNDFSSPNNDPGIYVIALMSESKFVWTMEIAYIGMSTRLRSRLCAHEAYRAVRKECGRDVFIQRFFKYAPAEEIRAMERQMIEQIKPRLNITFTKTPIGRRRA
jgi:hypothetical protein